jgi:hypothetical protein
VAAGREMAGLDAVSGIENLPNRVVAEPVSVPPE